MKLRGHSVRRRFYIALSIALAFTFIAAPLSFLSGTVALAAEDGIPSLQGVWQTVGAPPKLVLTQNGSSLKGRINHPDGRTWMVEGIISANGVVQLERAIPRTDLRKTPDAVFNQLLRVVPDSKHPGFLLGKIRLQYDPAKNELAGQFTTIHAEWNLRTLKLTTWRDDWHDIQYRRDESDASPKNSSSSKAQPQSVNSDRQVEIEPSSNAHADNISLNDLVQAFRVIQTIYNAQIDDPNIPSDLKDIYKYRLGLIDRFFAFYEIFKSEKEIEVPGSVGGKRPLIERDLIILGATYFNLLLGDVPKDLAPHINANWQQAHPDLIFRGLREFSVVKKALAQSQLIRVRVMTGASLEGMMGAVFVPLGIIPGGTLFSSIRVLITGENIDGTTATVLDKLFAVADITLDAGPVVVGVLRNSSLLRNQIVKSPLLRGLADRIEQLSRLRANRNSKAGVTDAPVTSAAKAETKAGTASGPEATVGTSPGTRAASVEAKAGDAAGTQSAGTSTSTKTAATVEETPGTVATTGETTATAIGKRVHKAQADARRAAGNFDLVNQPITDKNGKPILVSKRVDLETGQPANGAGLQEAIPDAVSFERKIIVDDKPKGRPIRKDRQEIIRFINAYKEREGRLPEVIEIHRYDPATGSIVNIERYTPGDFLPGGTGGGR